MPEPLFTNIRLQKSLDCYEVADDYVLESNRCLAPLKHLNFFVGPNNSGKSMLLRRLFYEASPVGVLPSEVLNKQMATLEQLRSTAEVVVGHPAVISSKDDVNRRRLILLRWRSILDGKPGAQSVVFGSAPHGPLNNFAGMVQDLLSMIPESGHEELRTAAEQLRQVRKNLPPDPTANRSHVKFVYLPVVRSLRVFMNPDSDLLGDRCRSVYFPDIEKRQGNQPMSWEVLSGQLVYRTLKQHRLGQIEKQRALDNYEKFLSVAFFHGDDIRITARDAAEGNADREIHISIGGEAEQPIFHLGDGLQHIILLTLPFALWPQHDLCLFVEEPELCLHPGFQRRLVDYWLSSPSNRSRQVFAATHSTSFIDQTLDTDRVQVFRIQKKPIPKSVEQLLPTFTIEPVSTERRSILADLGVRNSSVLLANCTVWVEGITDRMYIRHFLQLLRLAEPKSVLCQMIEDLHYTYVEYGGSCITHWSFSNESDGIKVSRLCGNPILIMDQDDPSNAAKQARQQALLGALGDQCFVLPVREIENLVSPRTLAQVVNEYVDGTVASESFIQSEYALAPLGRYIDSRPEVQSMIGTGRKRSFAADSGTIRDKRAFAQRIIDATLAWDDLTDDAKKLARSISDHIVRHNP